MRYFKVTDSRIIVAIGKGNGGEELSEAEYNAILEIIRNKPASESGYDYRLCDDLTWEQYEVPSEPAPDFPATDDDYETALGRFGV